MLSSCAQTSLTTPLRSEHYAVLLLQQDAKTSRERVHHQTEIMNGMLCSPIREITNYHPPRRRPQTQVRRAAATRGRLCN